MVSTSKKQKISMLSALRRARQDFNSPGDEEIIPAHLSSLRGDGDPGGGAAISCNEVPRWKRILDLSCIIVSLPCWVIALIVIALWIKLVSPGPLFYCQERVGYRGRRFLMFKFRTMQVNVETLSHERHLEQLMQGEIPMTKLDASGDPRIIPGGRFIRALGLDELMQLLNVLRGEMSLVGPRPCTSHEFENYQPWQRERTNALPGLTGYWQVNGKNKTTFSQMVKMDIHYARCLSLRLDLAILFRTLPAIIGQVLESRLPAHSQSVNGKRVSRTVT